VASGRDYDVVIAGGSLAGSTAAMLFGRRGLKVALVERQPSPDAYKTVCTHFIQSSAVPTLERLGALPPLKAAGAVESSVDLWSRYGWIRAPANGRLPPSLNLRREKLDPLLRRLAAETGGVDFLSGQTVDGLVELDGGVGGVEVRDRGGRRRTITARLVVGADGRDSRVAELSRLPARVRPHNRFGYFAYYADALPANAPRATIWFLDPQVAYSFPTDDGLTLYACFLTKDRLAGFKRDPAGNLDAFLRSLPDPPPVQEGRRVSKVVGKLDMPNVYRRLTAPGLALVGDAALASDPLWGVGCGWALQSAEWLADSTSAALAGDEPLERGLRRYARRHRRRLSAYEYLNCDYSTGRKLSAVERMIFAAAARDERCAADFEAFGTRNMPVRRFLAPPSLARMAWVNARHVVRKGPPATPRISTPSVP
jgi:2-polyprenyl-6-methoxyphenol hydroxylase-like FAD-dependent oxidoreductase